MKCRSVSLFVLAHAATDLNQGAIPIFLPYFIAAHHVSYTAVAMIVFVTNLISTLMQPAFGYIADRKPLQWLIPSAMIMTGIGASLSGLAPTFDIALATVALSGLGFAAFQPEGAKLINCVAGEKKATGSIIGNLFGGRVADLFGYRLVIMAGFILLSCCLPLLLIAPTASWFVMLFAPIGLVLSLPVSPMVVLGQSCLPNHVGLASGVTIGLALSFGGIMTPFLGMIADHYGLHTTISMLAVLPVICTCLTLALKKQKDAETAEINS